MSTTIYLFRFYVPSLSTYQQIWGTDPPTIGINGETIDVNSISIIDSQVQQNGITTVSTSTGFTLSINDTAISVASITGASFGRLYLPDVNVTSSSIFVNYTGATTLYLVPLITQQINGGVTGASYGISSSLSLYPTTNNWSLTSVSKPTKTYDITLGKDVNRSFDCDGSSQSYWVIGNRDYDGFTNVGGLYNFSITYSSTPGSTFYLNVVNSGATYTSLVGITLPSSPITTTIKNSSIVNIPQNSALLEYQISNINGVSGVITIDRVSYLIRVTGF